MFIITMRHSSILIRLYCVPSRCPARIARSCFRGCQLRKLSSKSFEDDQHQGLWDQEARSEMNITGGQKLYPTHIPTSNFQKILLSVGSAAMAITDPWRGDMVATMGETTGYFAIVQMRKQMMSDAVGRMILKEQPRINTHTVNLNYLRSLPNGTFGRTYVQWLDDNNASPDERMPVSFVDDPDLAYVMTRYREVHDLFHTVLGMPTNMLGEITVKWFEAIQTGLPMCALGAIFGPVRLGPKHRAKYLETHLWWAIRNGLQAKRMMCVYFEKHWEQPIEDLRRELNVEEPPPTPQKAKTGSRTNLSLLPR